LADIVYGFFYIIFCKQLKKKLKFTLGKTGYLGQKEFKVPQILIKS